MKLAIEATPVALSLGMAVKMATTRPPMDVEAYKHIPFLGECAMPNASDAVTVAREGLMISFTGPRHCAAMQKIVVPVLKRLEAQYKAQITCELPDGMDYKHTIAEALNRCKSVESAVRFLPKLGKDEPFYAPVLARYANANVRRLYAEFDSPTVAVLIKYLPLMAKEPIPALQNPNFNAVARYIYGDSGKAITHHAPKGDTPNSECVAYAANINKWFKSLASFTLEESAEDDTSVPQT